MRNKHDLEATTWTDERKKQEGHIQQVCKPLIQRTWRLSQKREVQSFKRVNKSFLDCLRK